MDNKVTAEAYSASVKSEKGMSPLQWGDKCFLCSARIGESDPRDFYVGSSGAMMLCHSRCLVTMQIAGGKPEDYHRAIEAKKNPPLALPAAPEPAPYRGPGWLKFPGLTEFQTYIASKGNVPPHVKVSIGDQVVQSGG